MKVQLAAALPSICGWALSILAGAAGYLASLPLAWVLGPLLVAAILSLSGCRLIAPVIVRRLGQLLIGATAGLTMTVAVLAQIVGWLPVMFGSALISIVISSVFSVVLARSAGLDAKTAFFASLPGGLTEMGNIGAQVGAQPEPIAIVQTLRVALVVAIVPPALVAFGLTATALPPDTPPVPVESVLVLLAAGTMGALMLGFARLNNPWVLGAILAAATLTATGLVAGHMPPYFFWAGQLMIGFSLGTRFRRSVIRKLPRVALIGTATTLASAGTMVGYALILAGLTELDFASATLATSPGGMSEMAATAQALNLSVALVVAFHVLRALMVNGFATYHWAILTRIGLIRGLQKLMRMQPDPDRGE